MIRQPVIKLKDLLDEVRNGEIRLKVVDKKLFGVPKQRIEYSPMPGTCVRIKIPRLMRIKMA